MSNQILNLAFSVLLFFTVSMAFSQELLLDQMVEAGGLKLFPAYGNKNKYYYLPDKVKIPRGRNGKPQFSFLKFARPSKASGEGGIQAAEGGGLVHFLVNFEVDDRTRQEAERELQNQVGGARIAGPATYKSGTFALISNFQQEDGDWTKRVLGLGKAPVMEGHKAAISMRLTREGATLLWESFQQAASDISVSFDMIIDGYRNPYEAKLTAHWDKIAKNRSLAIGSSTDWLGIDVHDTMKKLRDDGAIELEVKGEDAKMDKLWETAYGRIAEQIFTQVSDPTTLATLQDDPNLYSNFERAQKFNQGTRDRVARENKQETERERRDKQEAKHETKYSQPSLQEAEHWPFMDKLADQLKDEPDGENKRAASNQNNKERKPGSKPVNSDKAQSTEAPRVRSAQLQTPPSFSLLASYRKKQFKSSGRYTLNMKKWTTDTQAMRFDENIGTFGKRMIDDPAHFREVNLDDPVYKQREIVVRLDGQNSADFGKYVNHVTVSLRKKHEGGDVTHAELKIDNKNFNRENNNFTMAYGYKGDKDRDQWLRFEYKTVWSLYGGIQKDSGWQESKDFMLTLIPPHTYREITLEADPYVFEEERVRLATITLYNKLLGKENKQLVSLKPKSGRELSKVIRIAHDPENYEYDYEINWRLRGGKKIDSGIKKTNEDTIFVDELP